VTAPYPDDGLPAKQSAYIVGHKIVQLITNNWEKYQEVLPYQLSK